MEIEKEIEQIKQRNKRVEQDKAWETSWTRRICIMILTYIVVIIYSYLIRRTNKIALSSLVPVIGFTLSTLSLKLIRRIWEIIILKNKKESISLRLPAKKVRNICHSHSLGQITENFWYFKKKVDFSYTIKKRLTNVSLFFWCGWEDLNLHSEELVPKTSASANFATSAFIRQNIY